MKKIRILIADDHPIVREGYKKILMSQPDMDVTGEAGNGQEVLDLIQKKDFDLILLDISMPGRSGLEILKELKSQKPHLPVMILSIYPEEQYAVRAFRDGASGYLTKASTPKELISAIRKVSQGGRYVTEALAEKLTYFLHGDVDKAPHEKLSDREYQVMLLIASGKTVTQAAEELCLSVKTISTYRRHILEKMQFSTNAEITMYAIQNKLLG
jgi:two-component system invasion response regulator UvrY